MTLKSLTYLEIDAEHYRLMKVHRNKSVKERYELMLKYENKKYISKESLIKRFKLIERRLSNSNTLWEIEIDKLLKELEK
jgi:hypothetical protein